MGIAGRIGEMGTVDRAGIALALFGAALGFGAWLYVLVASQPNVYVGFALALGCVTSLSAAFLVWLPWRLSTKIPIVTVFSMASMVVFIWLGIPAIASQPDIAAMLLRIEKAVNKTSASDQADIDFRYITIGETRDKPIHSAVEVHYSDGGKRAAVNFVPASALDFSSTALADGAILAHQDNLLASLLGKPDGNNVAYPGTEGLIRIPESAGEASDRLSRERLNILNWKMYLYVLIAMKYRDDTMPGKTIKITEWCFRFNGPISIYLQCGRNGPRMMPR
jgi:hypothetical protein